MKPYKYRISKQYSDYEQIVAEVGELDEHRVLTLTDPEDLSLMVAGHAFVNRTAAYVIAPAWEDDDVNDDGCIDDELVDFTGLTATELLGWRTQILVLEDDLDAAIVMPRGSLCAACTALVEMPPPEIGQSDFCAACQAAIERQMLKLLQARWAARGKALGVVRLLWESEDSAGRLENRKKKGATSTKKR